MPKIEINGVNLYYKLVGNGRPVFVFVHGGMCDHRDWMRQVQALSPTYTVLTLDLRAHGLSQGVFEDCRVECWADDVNALIYALKLAPVVLVGHSLGARIVVEAAARRLDQIAALILIDGSRMYGGLSTKEPSTSSAPPAVARSTDQLHSIIDALIGPYASAATRNFLQKNLSSAPPALMQAAVDAIQEWDVGRADDAFAALRAGLPMLVIQSTYHDRFTRRHSLQNDAQRTPYLDFVTSACPSATVRILTGVGHFSMLERSDEVTSLIQGFGAAPARSLPGGNEE